MTETAGASSVYAAMASWLTPSFLFIFINFVIGTIAITSRFANTTKKQHQLAPSPSLLHRLTSFNLRYHTHEPTATPYSVFDPVQTPDSPRLDGISSSSLLDRIKSFNKTETEVLDPVQSPDLPRLNRVSSSLLDRIKSFNLSFGKEEIEEPDSVQQQLIRAPSILQRIKSFTFDRSASVKDPEPESEAEVTGDGELVEEREEEEGVDAKADDFINRFRQQLRLQRLHSVLRYRDVLKRN
ncbi:hypothetical protein CR513_62439, partial [Mucuna pruriens]